MEFTIEINYYFPINISFFSGYKICGKKIMVHTILANNKEKRKKEGKKKTQLVTVNNWFEGKREKKKEKEKENVEKRESQHIFLKKQRKRKRKVF